MSKKLKINNIFNIPFCKKYGKFTFSYIFVTNTTYVEECEWKS